LKELYPDDPNRNQRKKIPKNLIDRNPVKSLLKSLQEKYCQPEYLSTDPIIALDTFSSIQDKEIIGLISALYSYGNVRSIQNYISKIIFFLSENPSEKIRTWTKTDSRKLKNRLGPYRFQTEEDTIHFLESLSSLLRTQEISKSKNSVRVQSENLSKAYGYEQNRKDFQENPENPDLNRSQAPVLESLFWNRDSHSTESWSLEAGILNFQSELRKHISKSSYGLDFLIGKEKKNSAYKRYTMFLRWMVGTTYPDLGIYTGIPEEALLFPLDTHILNINEILGLSQRKSKDRKLAEEITARFRELVEEPASRYDFALSRLGIVNGCKAKWIPEICSFCEIHTICKIYQKRFKEPGYTRDKI
jgi:uncharacterized protein (TIGR02757 family)